MRSIFNIRLDAAILTFAVLIGGGEILSAQTYDSLGKRDPFIDVKSLGVKKPTQFVEPPPLSQRPPGLAGLLLSEVTVTGMASNQNMRVAIVKGIDEFTYMARPGTRLYDGYVAEVLDDQVHFIRERVDVRVNKHVTKVVKRLYTEEH